MKKTLITLAFAVLATVASYAQGTITFQNNALTRAQWETGIGAGTYVNIPVGSPIVYGVFWGNTADNLTLASNTELGSTTPPAGTTPSAGIIYATSPYSINAAEGATVFMKIAGWSSKFGRDAAAAKDTPSASAAMADWNFYGETGVRSVTLAAAAGPGTVIWSGSNTALFQPLKLNINPVPEPSVIALGVLGVGALLLRRRKNA